MAILTGNGIIFDPIDTNNIITSYYWMYPAGTKKVFYQADAPTGWTKNTTQNNKMLRVVSGAGGGSGGTNSLTSTFPSSGTSYSVSLVRDEPISAVSSTGNTTLSLSQLPDHTHSGTMGSNGGSGATPFSNAGSFTVFGSSSTGTMNESTGGGAHNHPWSGTVNLSATVNGTTTVFDIQYIDVIICTLS
jgi:hypothetical protein